jgi:hypothetical protein
MTLNNAGSVALLAMNQEINMCNKCISLLVGYAELQATLLKSMLTLHWSTHFHFYLVIIILHNCNQYVYFIF